MSQIISYPNSSHSNLILQNWEIQDKNHLNTKNNLCELVLQKIGLAAGAILLLPSIPFLSAYKFSVALKEKYTISQHPESPLAAIRNMKYKEELDKFKTVQSVLKENGGLSKLENFTSSLTKILNESQFEKNRSVRLILRALCLKHSFNPQWLEFLNDYEVISRLSFTNGIVNPDFLKIVSIKHPDLSHALNCLSLQDWKDISIEAHNTTISNNEIAVEVKKFEILIADLLTVLSNSQAAKDPIRANQKFISAFRKVLTSSVYLALKEDSSIPSIKFLHLLANAIWNKTPSMEAYRDLGNNIITNTLPDCPLETNLPLTGEVIAEALDLSHRKMEKIHYTAKGWKALLNYSVIHPYQSLGSLASEGGMHRQIPASMGLGEYDSHGNNSNNPSLQGVTTITFENGGEAKVNNCYGGTPTIGDHFIAPEFEAILQAAENNQLAKEISRDHEIPQMVNYNNLQNLHKEHGEGPRSRTIMLLNKKYPLSFRGATFSKDSSLYLMKKPEHVVWNGKPGDFGMIMLNQLQNSFNPLQKNHGFYFYGCLDQWQPIFQNVILSANAHFENFLEKIQPTLSKHLAPQALQGAYQEYVYSLLKTVIELDSISTLNSRGISNPTTMVITACKENIDRGGIENTKYLYLRLQNMNQRERLNLILGAMHSRALSCRDRIILRARIPQILNFMKTTSPEEFNNQQASLLRNLGYHMINCAYSPFIHNH